MKRGNSDPNVPGETKGEGSRAWVRESLLICLGLKVMLLFLGAVVAEVRLDRPFRTADQIFGIWHQWDSKHYYDIAANGYRKPNEGTTLVLPPLLPMLIRVGGWFTGSLMSGGVLMATLISFLPGLLMYQLARCDLGEEDAFRAMLILFLFPSAFFIHIVYTEGLFLATSLGAFLSARRGNWRAAAIFGVLAGLTRINAFILAPALLFEAWGDSTKGRFPRILAAFSVFIGVAVYLWINYATAGDPLAFVTVQRNSFYRTFAWPWQGAMSVWLLAKAGGSNSMMNGVIQLLCIPLLLAACVIAALRQRPSYAIWTIGQVLVFTAQGFWLSLPRLALVLFPAFIWLAPRTARPVFGTLWFATSTVFLSFLAAQFAQGWWVS
jgi:Gpi18-like mannosyltransferase